MENEIKIDWTVPRENKNPKLNNPISEGEIGQL